MERVEDATVAATVEEPDEVRAAPPKRASGILWAIAIANLLLLSALVWSNRTIADGVERLSRETSAEREATDELKKQVSALAAKNEAMEERVGLLQQAVASRAAEDVVFLKIVIAKRNIDRKLARKIARHVHKYSRLYGQDPDLVLAIMAVESDFNPKARSHAGAVGLMQIMPQWKQVLGIKEDLSDPETSIRTGLQVLGFYQNMYGDLEMALTAYNRGPGPVDAALNRGDSPHNKYAPAVLRTYQELRSLQLGIELG